MKVSVIGLRGIPGILGGVETHCEEVMPRIAMTHPEISVVITGRTPYVSESLIYKGVAVNSVYAPGGKHSEAIVATLLSILKAARDGCDVLHIHAIGPALLTPLARLFGLRVVITHHGEDFHRSKWSPLAKGALRIGEWLGVHFAQRIIAVSPSLQCSLRGRFPKFADRIDYIPNGMSSLPRNPNEDETVLADFKLKKNGFVMVAARLVPEKGIDYLIDAHRRSGIGKPLVIAGSAMHNSNYSKELLKLASAEVIFTGNLSRAKLSALLANSELFILPSYHEGLPIAALEALSIGARVLLSDIAANKDLGLPSRHYFPVGDTEELARRLKANGFAELDNPTWDGITTFDWDTIADRTALVYKEIC